MTQSLFPSLGGCKKRFPEPGNGSLADAPSTTECGLLPSLPTRSGPAGGLADDDSCTSGSSLDSHRRLTAQPPSSAQSAIPRSTPHCRIRRAKSKIAVGKSPLVFADRPRPTTVVFFPGDIQSMRPKQMEEAGFGEFVKYSIHNEAMLRKLSEKHQANVIVIRPSRISEGNSVYSTLIDCDNEGDVKQYSPTGGAAMKLRTTLSEVADEFPEIKQDYILVGFSRGALVLNQLLSEASNPEHPDSVLISGFFNHISVIHHVDAGNEGPAFPSEQIAQALAPVFLPHQILCIHQSTYHANYALQMNSFVNSLRGGEAKETAPARSTPHGIASTLGVYNYNYHDSSLSGHFKLLEEYKTPEIESKSNLEPLLPNLPNTGNLPHLPGIGNSNDGMLSCSGRLTRSSHTRTSSRNKVITPKCCSDGIGNDFMLPQVPGSTGSMIKPSSAKACGLPALPSMRRH